MRKIHLPAVLTSVVVVLAFWTISSSLEADAQGNGASVTGKARFDGAAPKPARIDMSADPNCAKAHPTPAFS